MKAADVREALLGRWPADAYVTIYEAALDSMRQGCKLDALVISCWKSRGHELDGVEIKVSMRDWRRELKEPAKADLWWEHVHRFWVAVPGDIAQRVRAELPSAWGLLVVDGGRVKVAVDAQRHDARPIDWPAVVGLLRGCSGAGMNALAREHRKGYDEGLKAGEARAVHGDTAIQAAHDALADKVRVFEEASGLRIIDGYGARGAKRLGELVALLGDWAHNPLLVIEQLNTIAQRTEEKADDLRGIAAKLGEWTVKESV